MFLLVGEFQSPEFGFVSFRLFRGSSCITRYPLVFCYHNSMNELRMARLAMATRFELILYGERESYLRAIGEEALEEISRVEAQLSFYRTDSDVTDLNLRGSSETVPVDPRFFRLLQKAQELSLQSEGAFDITVAPLMQVWGFVGGSGSMPEASAIETARQRVGMQNVVLDEANYTVRFACEGVQIDLGAIGKGYAVDRAIDILRENEIENALLHGGTSTVFGLGSPPDSDGWTIGIQKPYSEEGDSPIAAVTLHNEALSVSAPHGKWFENEGKRYGHVIDPRTGYPTGNTLLAALVTPTATEGDALSTALLTLGSAWLPELSCLSPNYRALVAETDANGTLALCKTANFR